MYEDMKWSIQNFGAVKGKQVMLYSIENKLGTKLVVTNFGAAIQCLRLVDRKGLFHDVVLGFDTLDEYIADPSFIGVICGRVANRIHKASFQIDGKTYSISSNEKGNTLHGGIEGFNKKVWEARAIDTKENQELELFYSSPDGEEGFPGELSTRVFYSLNDNNEVAIRYEASTNKATHVNLTNHSYFNLAGNGQSILDHFLMIKAESYTEVDKNLIPTGRILPVNNTGYDFRRERKVGLTPEAEGYDTNFVLLDPKINQVSAILSESGSGIRMECFTTCPGIQIYTANHFNGSQNGKGGVPLKKFAGICLETQHFADSPNQPGFPSTLLRPGEVYKQSTIYKFIV